MPIFYGNKRVSAPKRKESLIHKIEADLNYLEKAYKEFEDLKGKKLNWEQYQKYSKGKEKLNEYRANLDLFKSNMDNSRIGELLTLFEKSINEDVRTIVSLNVQMKARKCMTISEKLINDINHQIDIYNIYNIFKDSFPGVAVYGYLITDLEEKRNAATNTKDYCEEINNYSLEKLRGKEIGWLEDVNLVVKENERWCERIDEDSHVNLINTITSHENQLDEIVQKLCIEEKEKNEFIEMSPNRTMNAALYFLKKSKQYNDVDFKLAKDYVKDIDTSKLKERHERFKNLLYAASLEEINRKNELSNKVGTAESFTVTSYTNSTKGEYSREKSNLTPTRNQSRAATPK